MTQATSKKRTETLEYVTEIYSEWPQAHHTGHTGVSHFGYSWEKETHKHDIRQPYILKNDQGDVITEKDYNSFILLTAPSRIPEHIYLAVQQDGTTCPVLWTGEVFKMFSDTRVYKEHNFASVSAEAFKAPMEVS